MRATKVFITGSSGLVGSHLVQLLLERGYSVVALIRSTSKKDHLLQLERAFSGQLAIAIAELSQIDKLKGYMSGCDVVVHTAASISAYGGARDLEEVNVAGTRSTLSAAISAKVQQFIHISSLAVITGEEDRFAATEDEMLHYCREPYANSKIDAEKIVMMERLDNRIAVTALRPGFIYGPNERSWMPRIVRAFKTGTAMLVGDGRKETNVIYVGNLCRAIELAMLNPAAFGQVYNLTDGQVVTKKELFDTICDQLGVPRVKVAIPKVVARLLVNTVSLVAPLAPGSLKGFLSQYSRAAYRLVAVNQGFDISKAERELNYVQRVPFAEGMARTLTHWKETTSQHPKAVGDSSFA